MRLGLPFIFSDFSRHATGSMLITKGQRQRSRESEMAILSARFIKHFKHYYDDNAFHYWCHYSARTFPFVLVHKLATPRTGHSPPEGDDESIIDAAFSRCSMPYTYWSSITGRWAVNALFMHLRIFEDAIFSRRFRPSFWQRKVAPPRFRHSSAAGCQFRPRAARFMPLSVRHCQPHFTAATMERGDDWLCVNTRPVCLIPFFATII